MTPFLHRLTAHIRRLAGLELAGPELRRRIIWLPALAAGIALFAGLFAAAPAADDPGAIRVVDSEERDSALPTHPSAPTRININTASREELMTIDEIGDTLAERIINNRLFCHIDELLNLERFPPAVIEANKDLLVADGQCD